MNKRLSFVNLDEDPEAIFKQCQVARGVAPVGKKFLSEKQKLMEAMEGNTSLGSMTDNDFSQVDSLLSQESVASVVEEEDIIENGPKSKTIRRSSQRRSDYFEEEKILTGTYFNVFEDLPPAFELLKQDQLSTETSQSTIEQEKTTSSSVISSSIISEVSIMKEENLSSDSRSLQIEEERNFDSYSEMYHLQEKKVRFSEDVIQFTISPNETMSPTLSSDSDSLIKTEDPRVRKVEIDSIIKEENSSVPPTKRKSPFFVVDHRRIMSNNEYHGRPVRNRILPVRPWLSEKVVYRTDANGLQTLLDVTDPYLIGKSVKLLQKRNFL